MKARGAKYGKALVVLLTMLCPGSLSAQNVSDTLRADTAIVKAEKLATQVADSLKQESEPWRDEMGIPLDTSIVDSLLKNGISETRRNKRNFLPDPIRSMWLGLVFPGGGQIYNRKFWKLPIIYGGFLGCTYALTWNNQMLRDYSQAYLDIMDDDPNTKSYENMLPLGYDITGKEERFKTIFKNKKDHFRKYRDMSIFAFVGVYLISVIDAYVDAELSSFDISRDLSIRLEPAIIQTGVPTMRRQRQNSYGLSCNVRF